MSSNDQQLQLLLKFICESVNSKVVINTKLLRDILDVIEGLMRGALNSKGKYDHSSLKLNCKFTSEQAQVLQQSMNGSKLLKMTHREHAIPLKLVLAKLYTLSDLSPSALKAFLENNLLSVLITREEQQLLDAPQFKIKDQMPQDWNGIDRLARFKKVDIKIVSHKVSRPVA